MYTHNIELDIQLLYGMHIRQEHQNMDVITESVSVEVCIAKPRRNVNAERHAQP